MRELTVDQAKALALARGAKLEMPGQVFNAEMSRVKPGAHRYTPGEKPGPATAPETFTRAEVERMLDERDAKWRAELDALRQSMPTPMTTVTMEPVVVPPAVVNVPAAGVLPPMTELFTVPPEIVRASGMSASARLANTAAALPPCDLRNFPDVP